jgi:hypothetical protein
MNSSRTSECGLGVDLFDARRVSEGFSTTTIARRSRGRHNRRAQFSDLRALPAAVTEYVEHYHEERNHQGLDNASSRACW